MTSLLESLPVELLDEICFQLRPAQSEVAAENILVSSRCKCFPYAHLARLVRTSKTLRCQIEPLLYESETARTVALYRAVREGNVDTIRRVIPYGASPDFLEVRGNLLDEVLDGTNYGWRVPTLYLALKFRQTAAFLALVEDGADMGHPALWGHQGSASLYETADNTPSVDGRARRKFVQHLRKPWNEALLRLLLQAPAEPGGDEERLQNKSFPIRHIALVSITHFASPDLMQLLLDKHADPNQLHSGLGHRLLSPLSAAVLTRSPEIFELLVSRGADVNGRDVLRNWQPMHIPVIAAATQMLQGTSGPAMMQLCLDHGANINRPCHGHPPAASFKKAGEQDDAVPHVCTTALLTFLESIESWNPSPSSMGPVDGLRFLLGRGASAVSPPSEKIQRKHNNTTQFLLDRTYGGASSAVELLLDKWGLEHLAQPEFFQVLELLISHGAARGFLARILVKYDSVQNPGWARPEVVRSWRRLLALLVADLDGGGHRVGVDAVLRRVIADKGKLRATVTHSPWRGVGEIGRASIDALIAAGADINARVGVAPGEATSPGRDTALQEVCAALIHTDGLHDEFHDHEDGHLCEYSLMNEGTLGEWFAFLVSRGADPYLEDTHLHREGESALSIMMSPMEEGRARQNGRGSLEKHLMRLVAVLRGTSEPLVYDGERKRYALEDMAWLSYTRQRGRHASGKQCLAR